jgi:hypothetical protein
MCSSKGQKLLNELRVKSIVVYDNENVTKLTEKFDVIFMSLVKPIKINLKICLTRMGVYKAVSSGHSLEALQQLELLKKMVFERGSLMPLLTRSLQRTKWWTQTALSTLVVRKQMVY